MLDKLRIIFRSNIKSLEILLVLDGVKPAARIMVKEDERENVLGFFDGEGLCYVLSDFKVVKEDKKKAYSDKGVKAPIGSSQEGYSFVYVSKDKDKAEEAKRLENEGRHKEMGIALGYPSCCAGFFEKHFEEESKRNNDFTLAALKESDGFRFPFYTNVAARHFDIGLLSHFPCSFNCDKSIEAARRHLEIVKKHDKESAEIIECMLKGAVFYTETQGVFLLRYPDMKHNRLFYKAVNGAVDNQLYWQLKNAEHIEILGKDKIMLDGLTLKNIGFMLFS